ncbi:MAG: CvpA family protein [Treponema sp.]
MKIAILDIVCISVGIAICIRVTVRGFIREFFSAAAFFLAALSGLLCYPLLRRFIHLPVKPLIADSIFFFIIFILVFLVIKSIQVFLSRIFDNEILGGLDKALGFFLGLAESLAVIIVLIFILQNQSLIEVSALLNKSMIAQFLQPAVSAIPQFLQLLQNTAVQAVYDV